MNQRKWLAIILSPLIGGLVYTSVISRGDVMESLSEHTWQILVPTFLGVVLAGFAYELLVLLPVASFLIARGAHWLRTLIVGITCWFAMCLGLSGFMGLIWSAAFEFSISMLSLGVPLVVSFVALTVRGYQRA